MCQIATDEGNAGRDKIYKLGAHIGKLGMYALNYIWNEETL